MELLFSVFAILLYIAASLIQGFYLFAGKPLNKYYLNSYLVVGMSCHGFALTHLILTNNGYNLGVMNAASLIALFILLLTFVSALKRPVENLFIALCPIAALLAGLSITTQEHHYLDSQSRLILAHILLSLLAYSVLCMAFIQALTLYIQEKGLKHHSFAGYLQRLPPLQTMEALLFELIGTGAVLLGLSLLSGFFFAENLMAQHLVHKTVLTALAFTVYCGLLLGRYRLGWRGYTAINWTIAGYFLLLLGYFGSKIVVEWILKRN